VLRTSPDTLPAQCREPGPGQEPVGRTVGRPHHDRRAAHEVVLRDKADAAAFDGRETAVHRVVAIVAHQEQLAFGHDHRGRIVLRAIAEVEHVVALAAGQRFAELGIVAGLLAVGFGHGEVGRDAVGIGRDGDHEVLDLDLGHGLAVEVQHAADHLHGIARKADHPLDIVDIIARRGLEDHHVAPLGLPGEDALGGQQRQAVGQRIAREAIGPLGREQIVAILQPRQHGSEGMLNGEKKKLRKMATISTSLITKTGKLSSFRGLRVPCAGLPGAGAADVSTAGFAGSGVSFIVGVMWRARASVKKECNAHSLWQIRLHAPFVEANVCLEDRRQAGMRGNTCNSQ
jgi:hypothetical protein